MANETRAEIRTLLEDDSSIPTRVGTRLILSMLTEMDDKIEAFIETQKDAHTKLDQRITDLENEQSKLKKNDVIEWVRTNPKTSAALFVMAVILINTFDDYIFAIASKWLGLP